MVSISFTLCVKRPKNIFVKSQFWQENCTIKKNPSSLNIFFLIMFNHLQDLYYVAKMFHLFFNINALVLTFKWMLI